MNSPMQFSYNRYNTRFVSLSIETNPMLLTRFDDRSTIKKQYIDLRKDRNNYNQR